MCDDEVVDVFKVKKGLCRVYWFGVRFFGYVVEKELKAWDVDAFEVLLVEVKRGRDKLEFVLEEVRVYENGGGVVSVDVGLILEVVVEMVVKEGSEVETLASASAAKKKRGGGGRKKVIEEEEEVVLVEVVGEEEM